MRRSRRARRNREASPTGRAGSTATPASRGPPGLDAAGQSTGTLTLITAQTSASSSEAAAYIDKDGHYAAISKEDCRLLLSEATEDHPVTVHLHHLGTYRVVATRDEASGSTVITGLSLEGDKALIRTQLLIELAVALVGALVVALAGRTMVRSALAPLERVARTAHRVASQPLERGEVSIEDRVEKADLDSSAEVGQVGGALNTLLGHVESALTARQRSETQVRQFVADASHELRTPLASIRGYTELIRREGADADLPEEATYALERVHSESVRMTALVEDLLLLARLDAGRELRREEVDLVGLLVDTVADARAAGPDHDWRLDLAVLEPPADATAEEAEDFLPEPPLVIGDEARLRQVVVNLLANARVHTPAGSHVTTTLAREGDTLIVRIHDDGPGIAPDVRDRLFERFARGDSSRERRTGSTGLGMSIALAIVQSHGGSIRRRLLHRARGPRDHLHRQAPGCRRRGVGAGYASVAVARGVLAAGAAPVGERDERGQGQAGDADDGHRSGGVGAEELPARVRAVQVPPHPDPQAERPQGAHDAGNGQQNVADELVPQARSCGRHRDRSHGGQLGHLA